MSRKILFSLLALLFLIGVANAAQIPTVVDPKNYPEVWTTQVYNNGLATGSGEVVLWDFNAVSSPADYTDRLNYITSKPVADSPLVAGVILTPNCPNATTCTMAIRGPVYAYVADSSEAVTAGSTVTVSSLAPHGQCGDYDSLSIDEGILGFAISAAPNTVANGGFGGTDGTNRSLQPIYIDPHNN